ncbi:hypothetical protein [Acetobacter sicerae]|uniref:hypothetical protein n=1 Tax=Acetobacter sicerae TaxID=85325 RepID=UPI00156B111E
MNWSQGELESASKVTKKTIADFEREARTPYPRTLAAIRAALESAGIEFISENDGGAGVRLRKSGVLAQGILENLEGKMLVKFFSIYIDPSEIEWIETRAKYEGEKPFSKRIYTIEIHTKSGSSLPVQEISANMEDNDDIQRVNSLVDKNFEAIGIKKEDIGFRV